MSAQPFSPSSCVDLIGRWMPWSWHYIQVERIQNANIVASATYPSLYTGRTKLHTRQYVEEGILKSLSF